MFARIEVKADALFRQLEECEVKLGRANTEPVVRAALLRGGDHYLNYTRRRFYRSQHGPWTPNKLETQRRKLAKGQTRGQLIATGRLLRSLTPGAPGNIRLIGPDGVRVGSSVPYLRYHQYGTRKMPRRIVFHTPDAETVRRVDAELVKAVDDLLFIIFKQQTAA